MKKLTALIAAAAFLGTTSFAAAIYVPASSGIKNPTILVQMEKDKDKDKDKMGKDKAKPKKAKMKKDKDKDKDKDKMGKDKG